MNTQQQSGGFSNYTLHIGSRPPKDGMDFPHNLPRNAPYKESVPTLPKLTKKERKHYANLERTANKERQA